MKTLNKYEQAITRNADWFMANQKSDGFIDIEGDEFYGIKGDATLIGHAVTVRMYAYALTGEPIYRSAAENSLRWLAANQDSEGGWKNHTGYTLDAAQCVFEGLNTYQKISGDNQYQNVLIKAAWRMVNGTIDKSGKLLLPNIIEIGEYAHFALLAWKTTGDDKFRKAADIILAHIYDNFDETNGFWYPCDKNLKTPWPALFVRPVLRAGMRLFSPRGRLVAQIADYLIPYVTASTHPQYSMSLMDSELLLDTLDGSSAFPELVIHTQKGIAWALDNCQGPFPGTLVESKPVPANQCVYPLPIINDTKMAAAWPTSLLLLAYCGLRDNRFKEAARQTADWLVSTQDDDGGFYNFQRPDGSYMKLQSGNVNFYVSMALWIFSEVYGDSATALFCTPAG